jgi:hypothetical protein
MKPGTLFNTEAVKSGRLPQHRSHEIRGAPASLRTLAEGQYPK